MSCGLTPEQRNPVRIWPQPAPEGDIAESVAYARQVAKQCMDKDGKRLPHITTANTTRDMDQIRLALGESKISYFGVSYGSYLGAVYTTLFPARSDRFVLDSVVNPDDVWRGVFRAAGEGTEVRFEDFAKWAAARDPAYELGSTPHAVRATYLRLVATLNASDSNTFRGLTRWLLYYDNTFAELVQNLQAIQRGTYVPPAPEAFDGAFAATLWGIWCGESSWPRDVAQYQRDVLADRKKYPITNGLTGNIWPCAFWPEPLEPAVRITDRGPRNVLLTQNLRDSATPWSGALAMRSRLGDRARLVSVDQGGHGAYLYSENACVTNAATTFLVNGTLPGRDVFCAK